LEPAENPSFKSRRLLVCVGPRCDAEGRGRALLAALREELAANPADAAITEVTTRDCLRACTRDPIVRLEPSGDLFSNPTIEDLLRAARAGVSTSAELSVRREPARLAKPDRDC
jgi:(2Fe-2S) ferredoxin